jgi:hypothetical protein
MEKLVNFAKGLLTNRLGIVLAALNLCYFLSRDSVRYVFVHQHGEDCVFSRYFPGIFLRYSNFDSLMIVNNAPALLASLFSGKFAGFLFPQFCYFTHQKLWVISLVLFVALQWLFIGWTAKTIGRKLTNLKAS